jgi:hypothetical protein
VSEFKHMRSEVWFNPHGSDRWEKLLDDAKISVTDTTAFGNGTAIVRTYEPGNAESMKKATNDLAAVIIGRRPPMKITEQGIDENGNWFVKAEDVD